MKKYFLYLTMFFLSLGCYAAQGFLSGAYGKLIANREVRAPQSAKDLANPNCPTCHGKGILVCGMCQMNPILGSMCPFCHGNGTYECGCVAFKRAHLEEQKKTQNMTEAERERYNKQRSEQIRRNQMYLDGMNSSNGSRSSNSYSCKSCGGTGVCSYCSGSGSYFIENGMYTGKTSYTYKNCIRCGGNGKCKACHGTGRIR